MFQGQESKRVDVVLEFYRQAALNMRMFVDLRFKHFTTFMVISGLLGAASFNVPALQEYRPFIQTVAIVVTLLFWLIDFRTSQYWRHELAKIGVFEKALNEGVHLILPPPVKVRLRSSFATNLLFALLLSVWVSSVFCEFSPNIADKRCAPKVVRPLTLH